MATPVGSGKFNHLGQIAGRQEMRPIAYDVLRPARALGGGHHRSLRSGKLGRKRPSVREHAPSWKPRNFFPEPNCGWRVRRSRVCKPSHSFSNDSSWCACRTNFGSTARRPPVPLRLTPKRHVLTRSHPPLACSLF